MSAPTRQGQNNQDDGRAKGRTIPHDVDLEADILGGILAAPSKDALEALAGVDPDIFYKPRHLTIAGAMVDVFIEGATPTLGNMAEALARTTGAAVPDVRAELADLAATHNYYGLEIGPPLAILERYRRQRQMLALTGELTNVAFHSTEWHTIAERINDLAHLNGAVTKLSTLEVIDFAPILRGDAPEVVPIWLARDDGKALLYPGRVHDFHAEPSVGKTWIALCAVAEVLAAGGNGLYIDLEDTAANAVDRLRKLGVADEHLTANRFRYINPPGGFGPPERQELFTLVDELNPDIAIIDGVAEALARDGLDENSNTDVVLWAERLPRPLARRGAAVVMLDHVTKNAENRSRGARGAGAKLAIIDGASYDVRLAQAYSAHREGLIKIIVAKDRPGIVGGIGEHVANVRVSPQGDGLYVELHVETPPPPGETFRPTGVMARIADKLAAADHPIPERWLVRVLRSKRAVIDEALASLVIDGYVEEVKDLNNPRARAYRLIKPYRDPQRRDGGQDRAAGDLIDARDRFNTEPDPPPPPELFDGPDGEDHPE